MKEFAEAAMPWIFIALTVVIFAVRKGRKEPKIIEKPTDKKNSEAAVEPKEVQDSDSEDTDNYMTEGMCIGMCLGVALGSTGMFNLSVGISLGMLLGIIAGMKLKK